MKQLLYLAVILTGLVGQHGAEASSPQSSPQQSPGSSASNARPATPVGNPGPWVTNADYPPDAWERGEEGTSTLTVRVDKRGQVESCTAIGPHASLNAAACKAVKARAQFTPAKDAKGRAISSIWQRSVRWQIPDNEDMNSAENPVDVLRNLRVGKHARISYIVETDGTISDCLATLETDGQIQQAKKPCEALPAKVTPLLDAEGKPSRERIEMRLIFSRKAEPVEAISEPQ